MATALAGLWMSTAAAQDGVQAYLDSIGRVQPLGEAVWGALAVRADGSKIASFNELTKMLPASNMKLITTGAAIKALGGDFEYETRLAYSGSIEDGTLKGDLYIIGGGDPTIGGNDSIAIPKDVLFKEWRGMLEKAGIMGIDGHVVGDPRFFDGEGSRGSWQYGDVGTYYGTATSGLCFYKNAQDFRVEAGAKVGDPISMKVSYPFTPWMTVTEACSTGRAGTGDELYLYTTDLAAVSEMRGTFAVDRKPKTVQCSNRFGAYTCANTFCAYLASSGIEVSGGAADVDRFGNVRPDLRTMASAGKAADQASLTEIGSVKSPSLRRIAFITNHISDNFYAETLLRTIGRVKTGSACYDSALVAERRVFKELGVNYLVGATIEDGSGLSRQNYLSPDFVCRFLRAMLSDDCFGDYISTIGQPGEAYPARLRKLTAEQKSRVYMKSGSMGGVLCFSGYVIPSDGGGKDDAVIFSIMTNNCGGPTWKTFSLIDDFIYKLL